MRLSSWGAGVVLLLFVCGTGRDVVRAQDAPTAEVQRAQDLLKTEEEGWRQMKTMMEQGQIYVREVVVTGVALPPEELDAITAPFEGTWLDKQVDISRLVELIKDACVSHGLKRPSEFTYGLYEGTLTIDFEGQTSASSVSSE